MSFYSFQRLILREVDLKHVSMHGCQQYSCLAVVQAHNVLAEERHTEFKHAYLIHLVSEGVVPNIEVAFFGSKNVPFIAPTHCRDCSLVVFKNSNKSLQSPNENLAILMAR